MTAIHPVAGAARAVLDAVLAVVLSPCCAACDGLLEHPTRGPVCPACWSSILPLTPPLCDQCGDPLSTWRALLAPMTERCGPSSTRSNTRDADRWPGRWRG